MELVSVVITTYNRPLNILGRAIHSVLSQTYHNIELTVVNDAPENKELADEISEYIKNINDLRIHYVAHKKNMGANIARNTGIKESNGKYIAFLDDDDEWLPQKIEKQIIKFSEDISVGMVYCGFLICSDNITTKKKTAIFPPDQVLKHLVEDNYIGSTSFPLILREALDSVGGFDGALKSCQEYELWLRIAEKYNVLGIEEPLGIYYASEDSTFKSNYLRYIDGDNAIIYKHESLFAQYPISYSNHFIHMATYMFKQKQFINALKYKYRALKTCYYNPNNITLFYIIRKVINNSISR